MSNYQPKDIKSLQVPPPVFGPWGRKWFDITGLAARYKVAQGPEYKPEMAGSNEPPKPTARVPGPKGSRQQTSGDLNNPQDVKPNPPVNLSPTVDDGADNFYIEGDPNAPPATLRLVGEVNDPSEWDLSDMYELHIPQEGGYEDVIDTKPEQEDPDYWELNPDWHIEQRDEAEESGHDKSSRIKEMKNLTWNWFDELDFGPDAYSEEGKETYIKAAVDAVLDIAHEELDSLSDEDKDIVIEAATRLSNERWDKAHQQGGERPFRIYGPDENEDWETNPDWQPEEHDEDWGLEYPELEDEKLDEQAFDKPTTGDEDRLQAAVHDEVIEVVREMDKGRFDNEELFVRYVTRQVEYLLSKQEEFRTTPFAEISRLAEKYAAGLWDWYNNTGEGEVL